MKLDKFQIGDVGAGAESGGDAIAGGHVGVGGVGEDAAQATGSEQNATRVDRQGGLRLLVENRGSADGTAIVHQQIGHRGEAPELDIGEGGRLPVKGAGEFAAGGITLGVQNAAAGVGAFAAKVQFSAIAIEAGAPLDEFLNGSGPFSHQGADGGFVAEPVSGNEGVL